MKKSILIAAVLFVGSFRGAEQKGSQSSVFLGTAIGDGEKENKSLFNPQVDNNAKLFVGVSTGAEQKKNELSDDEAKVEIMNFFANLIGGDKRLASQDLEVLIPLLNSVADDFNAEYSFTEVNMPLFLSKLKLFLENTKYQAKLKNLVQVLKDKTSGLPQFSDVVLGLEKAIQNKDAELFFSRDSQLRMLFSSPATVAVKSLLSVRGQTGWRGTIKNIKDAIATRINRARDYLFSKNTE